MASIMSRGELTSYRRIAIMDKLKLEQDPVQTALDTIIEQIKQEVMNNPGWHQITFNGFPSDPEKRDEVIATLEDSGYTVEEDTENGGYIIYY